ncbi:hypothetical protein FSP39_008259 [Pinctada imbricata]|uniref:Uncharacterized protein n=1 Tax=Pinctada imbricata TaxID=66713 RepID=A0AA89C701_PINIB|nr:hypothetical protein FSP39_008259 [Pinctada imbricata]
MKVEMFCGINDKKGVTNRERRTVVILAVVFLAIYTSFNSLQNLQSSINHAEGLGLLSLLCIYGTLMVFAILSPVAIRVLSAKGVVILTCCVNLLYVASNFYPRQWSILPSSILVGAVSGFLWPAQGVYVATCAQSYSGRTSKDKGYVLGNFYSTFSTIYVASGVTGNLLSSLLFSFNFYIREQDGTYQNTSTVFANDSVFSNHSYKDINTCGANYCPMFNEKHHKQLMLPTETSLFYLLGTFLLCVLIGVFLALFFLPPLRSEGEADDNKKSVRSVALSCSKIQSNENLLYLCPAFFVYGWTQSFKWTDITQVSKIKLIRQSTCYFH